MKPLMERKRLRREYVKRKGLAYTWVGAAGIIIGPLIFASIFLIFGLLVAHGSRVELFVCGLVALLASALMWILVRMLKELKQHIGGIPYVAPVTASNLPAEEILVRAADEPPVAHSDVLLRAAQGQETPKEELLRVSRGE